MNGELPQRKSLRLKNYDYSSAGAYFVTFCTSEKQPLLGCIPCVGAIHESPVVCLSDCGKAVARHILQLPERFPALSLDAHVIMPNHVHLLLGLAGEGERAIHESPLRGNLVGCNELPERRRSVLSKAIGYLKMNAGRDIRGLHIVAPVWQRGYYDHIIRDEADYSRIFKYMDENPAKWSEDCYYIEKE